MFNLFNKQPINYKEYTDDELFNQLINDINDIKLTNNNLKDENTKLKNTINDIQLNIQLDNKQKNNFIIKYNNDINNLKNENSKLKNDINDIQLYIQLDNKQKNNFIIKYNNNINNLKDENTKLKNTINDIKLTNNNLKDENSKIKNTINDIQLDNKQKNNDINDYKKICIYNQFHINKNTFSKKFNELIEFNKLISLTIIYERYINVNMSPSHCNLSSIMYIHHEFITVNADILMNNMNNGDSKINSFLYCKFLKLLKKYNFKKLCIIDTDNIINKLYGLIINLIINIQLVCKKHQEIQKEQILYHQLGYVTPFDTHVLIIIADTEIIHKNYENRNNNNKYYNIVSERQYFSTILIALNKIILSKMNISELSTFNFLLY